MKTDVDSCIRELAEWHVKNKRKMTQPELNEILRRHFDNTTEMLKAVKFVRSKPGKLRFRIFLRESKKKEQS